MKTYFKRAVHILPMLQNMPGQSVVTVVATTNVNNLQSCCKLIIFMQVPMHSNLQVTQAYIRQTVGAESFIRPADRYTCIYAVSYCSTQKYDDNCQKLRNSLHFIQCGYAADLLYIYILFYTYQNGNMERFWCSPRFELIVYHILYFLVYLLIIISL